MPPKSTAQQKAAAKERSSRSQAQQVSQGNQSSTSSSSSASIDTRPSPTADPHHAPNVSAPLAGPPPASMTGSTTISEQSVPTRQDQHIWICLIEPGGQLKPRKSVEVDTPRNVSALRDYAFSQMKLSGPSTDLLVFPPGTRVPRNYDEEDNAALMPDYSDWQLSSATNPYLIMAPPPVPTLALSTATQQTVPTVTVATLLSELHALQVTLQAEREKHAAALQAVRNESSLKRKAVGDVGTKLSEWQGTHSLDEILGPPPDAIPGDPSFKSEAQVQTLWNGMLTEFFQENERQVDTFNRCLTFRDHSTTGMEDGQKPDLVIGYASEQTNSKDLPPITFASCVCVIELKLSLQNRASFNDALGQILARYDAILAAQPGRSQVPFILGDRTLFFAGFLRVYTPQKQFETNRLLGVTISPAYPLAKVTTLLRDWLLSGCDHIRDHCGYLGVTQPLEIKWTPSTGQSLQDVELRCMNLELVRPQNLDDPERCDVYRAEVVRKNSFFCRAIVKVGSAERLRDEAHWIAMMSCARTDNNVQGLPAVELLHRAEVEDKVALVLAPQGLTSLYRTHLRGSPEFTENVLGWLRTVDRQLAAMHSIGIAHCDVKPSNIVCYLPQPNSRPIATLIDFEHCISLERTSAYAFSGTIRYASRRLFSIVNLVRRQQPTLREFSYLPSDDFESLFYTAFEILHVSQELPWSRLLGAEALQARVTLLEDDFRWPDHKACFARVRGAWEFLSEARLRLRFTPSLSELFPATRVGSEQTAPSSPTVAARLPQTLCSPTGPVQHCDLIGDACAASARLRQVYAAGY